jgi:hypothetical protein
LSGRYGGRFGGESIPSAPSTSFAREPDRVNERAIDSRSLVAANTKLVVRRFRVERRCATLMNVSEGLSQKKGAPKKLLGAPFIFT